MRRAFIRAIFATGCGLFLFGDGLGLCMVPAFSGRRRMIGALTELVAALAGTQRSAGILPEIRLAQILGATFRHLTLSPAQFSGATLIETGFGGAILHGTRFVDMVIRRSNFSAVPGAEVPGTFHADRHAIEPAGIEAVWAVEPAWDHVGAEVAVARIGALTPQLVRRVAPFEAPQGAADPAEPQPRGGRACGPSTPFLSAAALRACGLGPRLAASGTQFGAGRAFAGGTGLPAGFPGQVGLGIVGQKDAGGVALDVAILPRAERPQEGDEPGEAERQRDRDEPGERGHVEPPLRRALRVTAIDEPDMASAATSGETKPATAIGTASRL